MVKRWLKSQVTSFEPGFTFTHDQQRRLFKILQQFFYSTGNFLLHYLYFYKNLTAIEANAFMMYIKDYYKILEISPAATHADIKKSYRRLALQYHPDKNFGNQLYEAKFKEITEAYKVLSDVKQREEYNRSRNQYSHSEKKKTEPLTTPQIILNQTVDFSRKIAVLDPDRMNKLALFQQIQHLLSRHNISILQHHNDPKLNKRIIEEIMFCSRFLPFAHVERICFQLTAIAGTDNTMYRKIYNFSRQVRMQSVWNKYKILAAVILAIILCFAIYLIGTTI